MDYIKEIPAIRWKNGEFEKVLEKTVKDENIFIHIDELQVRKFSTYPKDLEDFCIGYALGEGLIKNIDDVESIQIKDKDIFLKTKYNHKVNNNLSLTEDEDNQGIIYESLMSDSAGGWRSELKNIEPVCSDLKIKAKDIIKNMVVLTDNAKIWKETGSVHVAQLIYGDEVIIREDVSRHVAVDKVIGAAARKYYDLTHSYICYSGRMPADMIIKFARVKIPIVISNAAPAGSGYIIADEANITMVGFVRNNRFNLYTAPDRVLLND